MARYKLILSCLSLFLPGCFIIAQDTLQFDTAAGLDEKHIKWVNQFPLADSDKKSQAKDKFADYIFGRANREALSKPVAILAKDPDDYWILDQGNGIIFRIKEQVGDIPHLRNRTLKYFPSLVGICKLPDDKLVFTDSYLNKLFTYSVDKKEILIFNDSLILDRPTGVAYSSVNQQIWVVETNAHCIAILNKNGQLIKKIGHRGSAPGEFNYPTYIWIDKFGKVFIVDAMNFRIQVFSEGGEFISLFGKNGDATGSFARPRGIATDSDGNVYVADALCNTIQIFDTKGNFLYNFGSQGQDKGKFWMPAGIYIDEHDFIYVADTYNARVQIFQYLKGAD